MKGTIVKGLFSVAMISAFTFFVTEINKQGEYDEPVVEEPSLNDIILSDILLSYSSLDNTKSYLTDDLYTDDELRSNHLDLATLKVVTPEKTGSGYFSDIDEENNKLYVTTNAHVVLEDTDGTLSYDTYVELVPTIGIDMIYNSSLCGQVISAGIPLYGQDELVDLATIEVTGYVQYVLGFQECVDFDFDITEMADSFKILEYKSLENINVTEADYYSYGYPYGEYSRSTFTYFDTSTISISGTFYHKPHVDFYIGYSYAGQSGSAIVNQNLSLVSTLFGKLSSTQFVEGYDTIVSVSTYSQINYLSNFCNTGDYSNLRHCSRIL